MQANISEIFRSVQGEGPLCGLPFVFIRFGGCHLRCAYCDTPNALNTSPVAIINIPGKTPLNVPNPVSKHRLLSLLENFTAPYICFTGGEPLLQSEVIESLLPELSKQTLLMETSGTLSDRISDKLLRGIKIWSVDIKLPSVSGLDIMEQHALVLRRMQNAKKVIVKSVFSDDTPENEMHRAIALTEKFLISHPDTTFIFQPLTLNGKSSVSKHFELIMHIMEKSPLNIRLIPQIHPLLSLK